MTFRRRRRIWRDFGEQCIERNAIAGGSVPNIGLVTYQEHPEALGTDNPGHNRVRIAR
jgi:hypothetical protein